METGKIKYLTISLSLPIFLALSNCAEPPAPKYAVAVGEEHVSSFKQAARAQGRDLASVKDNLIMELHELGSNTLGSCHNGGQKHIKLNSKYWTLLSPLEQQQLVWHELGHCWLGREHLDTVDGAGEPVSIMNTYHMPQETFWGNYGAYVVELFK